MFLMNKDILRRKMLLKRKAIVNKEEQSAMIIQKIMNLDVYKKAKVIGLYKSLPNEVNLEELINYSLNIGKIVLLPRVIKDNLVFIKINNNTVYEKSLFKVLEPEYKKENIYQDKIDLVIVPGLCFDYHYNRLGYGKGYYDRFLAQINTYKIGVCFKEQMITNVCCNENDIPMDLVIYK